MTNLTPIDQTFCTIKTSCENSIGKMDLANSESSLSGSEMHNSCSGTLIAYSNSSKFSGSSTSSNLTSKTSIINSATFVHHSDESDIDSFIDDMAGGDVESYTTKIHKFVEVLSPEKLQEKKEKHEKWLKEKLARQRELKRREQEKIELEMERKEQIEEERRQKCADSTKKWMEKKKIDANRKITRLQKAENDFLKRQQQKKEKLAKKISYDEWMESKTAEVKRKSIDEKVKKRIEKVDKKVDKIHVAKSQTSYQDWLAASKFKPKPVPFNRGLESLRGSLAKLNVNPTPWQI